MKQLDALLAHCTEQAFDLHFSKARQWKAAEPGRLLLGFLPIYFPREIVHAVNGMGVGIMGVGDRKQIIKGDAYYQSYICHLPRGVIEMALDNSLDDFDGFVFPAICDPGIPTILTKLSLARTTRLSCSVTSLRYA